MFKVRKIPIHLYCSSHVGGQKNAHQPIFPYNIIENSPYSLPLTLLSRIQITSNLIQRHIVWSYKPYQNSEQIDHNLHNHVFDDVIYKPSIANHLLNMRSKPVSYSVRKVSKYCPSFLLKERPYFKDVNDSCNTC